MTQEYIDQDEFDPELLQVGLQAIQKLKYGQVNLTIHDSRVVQVERVEKTRIQGTSKSSGRSDLPPKGGDALDE